MCHRRIEARAATHHTDSRDKQPANGSIHCSWYLSTLAVNLGWQTAIHHKLLVFPLQPGEVVRSFYSIGVVICAFSQVKLMTVWDGFCVTFSKYLICLVFLFQQEREKWYGNCLIYK
jgi:hypothetical protein